MGGTDQQGIRTKPEVLNRGLEFSVLGKGAVKRIELEELEAELAGGASTSYHRSGPHQRRADSHPRTAMRPVCGYQLPADIWVGLRHRIPPVHLRTMSLHRPGKWGGGA